MSFTVGGPVERGEMHSGSVGLSLRAGLYLPRDRDAKAFHLWIPPPPLLFHKLKGSQVAIWDNYWDQSSWLT